MGVMGGIGMMSAGLLGGPGIGYDQDAYISRQFQAAEPELYAKYKSAEEKTFLLGEKVSGLDGNKLGELTKKKPEDLTADEKKVLDANLAGGKYALRTTSWIPAIMGLCYLALVGYFASKGGYKVEEIAGGTPHSGEQYTGGVEGPMEG
jgi:hypothetical protein